MLSLTTRAAGRGLLAAIACAAVLLPAAVRADQAGSYTCPVEGDKIAKVTADTPHADYKGVRYYFCCGSCPAEFNKEPAKYAKDSKGKVIGMSLFDPVTTKRIDPDKAAGHSDVHGVRYFFASADDKKSFDKNPKKYTASPEKHVLYCPVNNQAVASYAAASDYSDVKGTRYYFCCAGCKPAFDKDPDKYLKGIDEKIKAQQPDSK
ncbi:MAG TPA: YHS domain-containing protein [Chthonomonadaceae bacterium]|nr:YHS domain-containing protein [Chthonomonadaceae bacterium]